MKRQHTSWVIPLISITLVLFLLGTFALIGFMGQMLSESVKDSLEMKILLADHATDSTALALAKKIRDKGWSRTLRYLNKEAGAKKMKELGDDFLAAMDGVNPIPAALFLTLQPEYLNDAAIQRINSTLRDESIVREIYFPLHLLKPLNDNIGQLTTLSMTLGVLLMIVAIWLISNTIRLAIHSQRLAIRTKQLVGATNGFIRAPFLWLGVWQGLVGGGLASLLLFVALRVFVAAALPELAIVSGEIAVNLLFLCLILVGGFMGLVSSFWAVNRYL
jgi:cell division transport system permease protein